MSGDGEAGKSAYSVVFEHAGIRYPDAAQEAVSDITLNVRPGETIPVLSVEPVRKIFAGKSDPA